MKSVGEQLREARLQKHWTPEAAAKASKIKLNQLIDLENDDYGKFANPAYARGFVRIYAKTMGLNDRKLLAQLDGKLEADDNTDYMPMSSLEYIPEQVQVSAPVQTGRIGQKAIIFFAIIFVVLGLGSLILRFYHSGVLSPPKATPVENSDGKASTETAPKVSKSKEVPVAAPAEAVAKATPVTEEPAEKVKAATPVNPAQAEGSMHHLMLVVAKSSWARIVSVQAGKENKLFEGVLEAGKKAAYQGEKFIVKLAAPSGVNVIFDGVDYGPYSDSDTPETFTIPAAKAD